MEQERTRTTPEGRIARQCVDELVQLKLDHQSTFDSALRVRALQSLRTLPILSTDEDPHFIVSMRALRVAAYFGDVQSPSTFALLNHITKHTYMLDGFNLYQLMVTLSDLQHPQTVELLNILRPRIHQVVLNYDITAAEVVLFLRVLHKYHIDDSELIQKLANIIQYTISDLSLVDVTRCISALPFTRSVEITQRILTTAEEKLCELLDEAVTNYKVYCGGLHDGFESLSTSFYTDDGANGRASKRNEVQTMLLINAKRSRTLIQELSNTLIWARQAPRRLINGLLSTALVYSESINSQEILKGLIEKGEIQTTSAETTEMSGSSSVVPPVPFEPKPKGIQAPHQTVPSFSRHDICLLMKALCEVHYRHERAFLILASRAVTARSYPQGNNTTQEELLSSDSPPLNALPPTTLLRIIQDLSLVVECLAYFYLVHARCTVAALLQEVNSVLCNAINPLLTTQAVEALSRLLVSLARLHYPAAAVAAGESSDVSVLESICTCEAITRYCMSPYCAQDILLASHLLSGVVQVSVQLQLPQGTTAALSLSVQKRSVLVSHLLKALSPSIPNTSVSRTLPSMSDSVPLNHVMNEITASIELIQANPSVFDLSVIDPALKIIKGR
ncbi:unnamed protein product [Phytomonas sp. Hart1]|nr:unnamed protein product [Phytomonas sp. Hart1]|eukprot:CCW68405.1 unnamed protein product [Phytomonas sp. isolate Hart1]